MANPVLYIDLHVQPSVDIEYREAAKIGILGALKILAQEDGEVLLRNEPEPEPDELNSPDHRPVSVLLDMARESAFEKDYLGSLDLDAIMEELRKRWGATTGTNLQFLLVRDPYISPIEDALRQSICRAEDSKIATISTYWFDRTSSLNHRIGLFTMMTMRLAVQLLGGPNEDARRLHSGNPCLMHRRNTLAEYEADIYPLYRQSVSPVCSSCIFDAIKSLSMYKALSRSH